MRSIAKQGGNTRLLACIALGGLAAAMLVAVAAIAAARGDATSPAPAAPTTESAANAMPAIAAIGVRIERHLPIPAQAKGPPLETGETYRLEELGRGLYMITDNVYQSMFLVYETGVVIVDAPPTYADKILTVIREVTDKPVTHLIYSHAHVDHIGGATELGYVPEIVAHVETKRLLERARDPRRPVPTLSFQDRHTVAVGSQTLELSYHGVAHEPGNIFIYLPAQETLMVVDVIFPGWMPWRRFALAQDVPGYFAQVEEIRRIPFKTLVAGHVARTGTRADVEVQAEFMRAVKSAAAGALATTRPGAGLAEPVMANPWAVFDDFIDRVAARCVAELTPGWAGRLAAFDVYVWDQCYAMEQSLRID